MFYLNNKVVLIFLLIYFSTYNTFSNQYFIDFHHYQDEKLSINDRADTLRLLYKRIHNASQKNKYRKYFFNYFPSDFNTFKALYGHNSESGPNILYYQSVKHINTLYGLDNIEKKEFARKVIKIAIEGKKCDDDAEFYFQRGLQQKYANNVKLYSKLLSEYSTNDIFNFWYFYFDGPHPENLKDDYEKLNSKVREINVEIANIMTNAYEKLLSEYDGHGK